MKDDAICCWIFKTFNAEHGGLQSGDADAMWEIAVSTQSPLFLYVLYYFILLFYLFFMLLVQNLLMTPYSKGIFN